MSATGPGHVALIERDGDLAVTEQVLARAAHGSGALLVVEGEAGIGKTSLLGAAAESGESRGQMVLRASGAEFENEFAFGVVRQLFEASVAGMEPARRDSLRGQAAGLALDVLDRSGSAVRAEPTSGLLHGVFWLAIELAEATPLVLLVDDAHWSDVASLRALAYLARRLDGLPIALVVAVRSGAASRRSPLSALLATPGTAFIRPSPLSPEGTRTLADHLVGTSLDDDAAMSCHAVTGGNPFLVGELAGALVASNEGISAEAVERIRESAPSSLRQALMLRFDALPPRALEVAQAVAVLGDDAAPRLTAALVELSVADALAAIDVLVHVGVLTDGKSPSFAHRPGCSGVRWRSRPARSTLVGCSERLEWRSWAWATPSGRLTICSQLSITSLIPTTALLSRLHWHAGVRPRIRSSCSIA